MKNKNIVIEDVMILLIKSDRLPNTEDRRNLEALLKRDYEDGKYLLGFLDGLLFGEYKLLSRQDFEKKHNDFLTTKDYLVYILTIKECVTDKQ